MKTHDCFICGKSDDEHQGQLIYEPFVTAEDCEFVYVHQGCIEPLRAIQENIAEFFGWRNHTRRNGA